ncbi:hypothetical protein J2S43_000142 [Catenuloplanes nepalensis]|uniref:Uncharacterized protein n=1 Tax=Catenuloplanes nepalensis TaxID=587533 RepID=A0ABT9MJN3_9ACTN|nr:hypothetical protein [Catenuloplanes nepalensis]MDP9791630.1 hypothetical protein [Catenuloplanes nepalensis]
MTDNPLVAAPKSVWDDSQKFAGAGLLDSGYGAWTDLYENRDFSAMSVGVNGISVGLDVLSIALNPLGELVKAGVGWVMEHVAFIREPLELLTGDHRAIQAVSDTWGNISERLLQTADRYEAAMAGIGTWTGEAAQGYRGAAAEYINGLRALAGHTGNTSQGVMLAGIVVATERAIIFDMIASFISRVIAQALIAAASSVVTVGGSVAAFLTSVSVDAALLTARMAKRLSEMLTVIKRFVARFDQLGAAGRKVADALAGKSQSMHNWADKLERANVRTRRDLIYPGGDALKYTRYVDRATSGPAGTVADSRPLFTGKEAAKATKDGTAEDDDG